MKNREIKFRFWDAGSMVDDANGGIGELLINDSIKKYQKFKGCVIMQYTGLKDKNGKEIYEGDIFEVIYSNCLNGFTILGQEKKMEKVYGVVDFKFGQFVVRHNEPEDNEERNAPLYSFLKNPKEIIGNIYENPELLIK